MIEQLSPERGGESEGIMRLTISLPISRNEIVSLRDWLNMHGFSPDVDQLDEWLDNGIEVQP